MDQLNEYQIAMKKVNLVERCTKPNGYELLDMRNVGRHEANDIIALAHQIDQADAFLRTNASGKLSVILEQIKFLQAQAHKVLQETEHNRIIHTAACNFKKVPGNIYHLYRRESNQEYLSMLSPEEWGSAKPSHKFLGSFRLELDQSWTPLDKIDEINKQNNWANTLMDVSLNEHGNYLKIDNITAALE